MSAFSGQIARLTLLSLVFTHFLHTTNARAAPNSEQLMSALGTCAANMNLEMSADVLGSIKDIFEGKGGQGHLSLKNAPDFLVLFPESERTKAYRIYVGCIAKIIGKNQNSDMSEIEAKQCTISLSKCKDDFKTDYKSSITSCKKYLECDPKNPGVYGLIGQSYRRIGQIGKSDKFFNKQMEFSNEFGDDYVKAVAYHNLAVNALMRGAPDSALVLVKKSQDINRDSNVAGLAANYKLIGDIYYRKSKFSDAISYFEKSIDTCIEIDHKRCLAGAYIGYSFTHLRLRNKKRACHFFMQAEKIYIELDDRRNLNKTRHQIKKFRCLS